MATHYDVHLKEDFDVANGIAANKYTKNLSVDPLSGDKLTVVLPGANGTSITIPSTNVLGIVAYTV